MIEPSCATPLAVVLKNKEYFKGKNEAIILTGWIIIIGGNVDIRDTKKSFGSLLEWLILILIFKLYIFYKKLL